MPGRLAFVGGLHRSGTSLAARLLASHPDVAVLTGSGVREDEGQHLQDVYPNAHVHGGPGRFAFRYVDTTADAADAYQRLLDSWAPWWSSPDAEVGIEKSPPNLLLAPWLARVFPDARFVFVVRHPIPVSYATQKWRRRPLTTLMRHWSLAHERALASEPTLRDRVAWLHYEDVLADPTVVSRRLAEFLDIDPGGITALPAIDATRNTAYWDRWNARPLVTRRLVRMPDPEVMAATGYVPDSPTPASTDRFL